MKPRTLISTAALASLVSAAPAGHADSQHEGGDHGLAKIKHIVVIYQENWSFDSLYGLFPGANGLANGFGTVVQRDKTASPPYSTYIYKTPQPLNNGLPDQRFPPGNGQPALPLIPYDFTDFAAANTTTGDIIHRFYHEQLQIDNGLLEPKNGDMDKFMTWSDNPGLVLSYADATNLPEGVLAQQYTLLDNFFHSAYGGSFLNHQFLVAAAAPQWLQPIPPGFQSSYDPVTLTLKDNNLTSDGKFAVNTTFSANSPHPAGLTGNPRLLASINDTDPSAPGYTPTIGDRLDERKISWKWYSGGWNNAIAGNPDPLFQFHHQAFAYYQSYADGTAGRAAHLQDEADFFTDVQNNNLPAVSFIKPLGPDNEHPGYANLVRGQQHVADLIAAIQASPAWKSTVVIITYDENGGRWDHVPPPMVDSWGLGTRVPGILVSPFARRGFIDHTQYETVSILKLIEKRFQLAPLSARDANPAVLDLTGSLKLDD
jgi:phospholipase C